VLIYDQIKQLASVWERKSNRSWDGGIYQRFYHQLFNINMKVVLHSSSRKKDLL